MRRLFLFCGLALGLLAVMETCYSGSIGTYCEGLPGISLNDLYYQLATHATGSHAGLYNDEYYGNVFRNTMSEYLTPID